MKGRLLHCVCKRVLDTAGVSHSRGRSCEHEVTKTLEIGVTLVFTPRITLARLAVVENGAPLHRINQMHLLLVPFVLFRSLRSFVCFFLLLCSFLSSALSLVGFVGWLVLSLVGSFVRSVVSFSHWNFL